MKKLLLLLLSGILFGTGCGNGNIPLGGTVTYEDGTPLPYGNVIFATDTFQASGNIDSTGKYTMGSVTVNDGLPEGTYKVYITGASEEISGKNGSGTRSLIDPKYDNYSSTPLTCEVPVPGKTFDITVPKNPKP
ncbi:MAG: carboxypeptidase-like regulatory domain-containing protein [Planctomycetaceae bacterium]|jgi:hypothetical protein|nr:carboxypeptidase-like regulatory domain-containing protein [Planctomycetaceae bacterium]